MKRALEFLFALLLAAACAPAQTQTAPGSDCGAATSCSVTFRNPVIAGHAVAFVLRVGKLAPAPAIHDSLGNAFALIASQPQTADGHTLLLYCARAAASGEETVTSVLPASATLRALAVEFSGSCAPESTAAAQGAGSSAAAGPVTAAAGEFVLSAASTANAQTFTAGAPFALDGAATKLGVESEMISSNSSSSAPLAALQLSSPDNWAALTVSFRPLPLEIFFPGCCTLSFPIASASQVPSCAPADGVCSIAVQICDANLPPVCLTGNRGTVSLLKSVTLPIPQIQTVPVVSAVP